MARFYQPERQTFVGVVVYFVIASVIVGALWLIQHGLLTNAEAVAIAFVLPVERIAIEYRPLPASKRLATRYSIGAPLIGLSALGWICTQEMVLVKNPIAAVLVLGLFSIGPLYLAVEGWRDRARRTS